MPVNVDKQRHARVRLIIPLTLVCCIVVIGTSGYLWLGRAQGATFLDALYMTVITITTVGYSEVVKLDSVGRLFTMFIAVTGVGSAFYCFGVLMEHLVTMRLTDPMGERRMQRDIEKLQQHVIIAGFGRVGKEAALELHESGEKFVIIDPRPETMTYARLHGFLLVPGDATHDDVLQQAGISRAKGVIVTTGDDANNLYIVLSARSLNAALYIVSRAVSDATIAKLKRAGADRAISPYAIGGRRLAHLILSPTVVDFFETVLKRGDESLNIEGITVADVTGVTGKTLAELQVREKTGASVLVLMRGTRVVPNPEPSQVVESGDQLLALGTVDQLDRLEALMVSAQPA